MITNFKIYENKQIDPKAGDYVIMYCSDMGTEKLENFLNNTIGKIFSINIKHKYADVFYDDIPFNLKQYFFKNRISLNLIRIHNYSKSKSELEIILNANKFNI